MADSPGLVGDDPSLQGFIMKMGGISFSLSHPGTEAWRGSVGLLVGLGRARPRHCLCDLVWLLQVGGA